MEKLADGPLKPGFGLSGVKVQPHTGVLQLVRDGSAMGSVPRREKRPEPVIISRGSTIG